MEGIFFFLFSISFRRATHATLRCAKAIKITTIGKVHFQQLSTTAIPSSPDVFLLEYSHRFQLACLFLIDCHLLCPTNSHERHSNTTFTFCANDPLHCRTLHHHTFSTNVCTNSST